MSTLIILAGTEVYFKSARYALQAQAAQDQLHFQMQLMLMEQEKGEQLKALHHDIKNHLNILKRLSEIEQVREYVEQVKEAEETTLFLKTGNAVLDVILEDKKCQCETKGIELKAGIRMDQIDFLTPMEICTIFVNCLDNAMEAVTNCKTKAKVIEIAGGVVHDHWVVRIQNPFEHALKKQKGQWLSTKGKAGFHGYGLKNVQQVIEKHQGTLTIEDQDQTFIVTWMIPKPENA